MSAGKNFLYALTLAVLACAAATDSAPTDEADCPLVCPDIWKPVCATDGEEYKQFSNDCELAAQNCHLRSATTFAAVDMDWCTTEYAENLFEKLGPLNLNIPDCLRPCPMIWAPVCVSNGKYRGMVANDCMRETYECALSNGSNLPASKAVLKVLKQGSC